MFIRIVVVIRQEVKEEVLKVNSTGDNHDKNRIRENSGILAKGGWN